MEIIIRQERMLVFLLIAGVVSVLAKRFKIPYTVGLVLAGIVLSIFPLFSDVPFTKNLIFNVFLPPLIFEAAIQIRWKELRESLPVVLLLVTVGVCLSAAVTALGMRYLAGWAWINALLFGVLIAATDPVSVVATFKEAGVHGRLRLLVESESIFNDGTAAVLFSVVLTTLTGSMPTIVGVTKTLILTVGGGMLCGAVVAGIMLPLMAGTRDYITVFTFTTIVAYGSFLLAEHFHFSGVLAALTAGILVGNVGPLTGMASQGREAIEGYWDYLSFLANSLIFMGIGIHEALQNFKDYLIPAAVAILVVLVGRLVAIYPCCAVFRRPELVVKPTHRFILFWGGLRGALALALAVGLPESLPGREAIISVTFVVVGFSIFVQGLTMTPLLRRTGEIKER